MLEEEGFRIDAAHSAEQALEAMERNYFDAVVCDFKMPGLSGFDFIRALRSIRQVPQNASEVPIILFTAEEKSELPYAAMKIGANKFCQKKSAKHLLSKQLRSLII